MLTKQQYQEFKVSDLFHYLANGVVSDKTLLFDDEFLQDAFYKAGVHSEYQEKLWLGIRAAQKAQPEDEELNGEELAAKMPDEGKYVRMFSRALIWAQRNKNIMEELNPERAQMRNNRPQISQNSRLRIFLGD